MTRATIAAALLALAGSARADAIADPCTESGARGAPSAACVVAHAREDYFIGFVIGIATGLIMQSHVGISGDARYAVYRFPIGDFRVCMPEKLPIGVETLVSPVREYLRKKPEDGHWGFSGLLPQVLAVVYPCPEKLQIFGL